MEEIVAGGKFKLVGTGNQNSILAPVFSGMTFPWEKITQLPHFPVPISWDNLNDGTLRAAKTEDDVSQMALNPTVRKHGDGPEGHAISRPMADGRMGIAGVFWTDGRIKIDISLESHPASAREVLSAELAHAVDYGLPLTSQMKAQLSSLLHPQGADQHTWWEKVDYGSEYYTLVGEAFMAMFTHAFYPGVEPWQTPFTHKSTAAMGPQVRAIMGIGTGTTQAKVYSLKGYRTFHKPTHFVPGWNANPATRPRVMAWDSAAKARAAGLVACKVCKPV